MAIAFDAISTVTSTANTTSLSLNHTAAGSNRVAVVIVHLMRNTDGGIAITAATYGGQAMTERATIEWRQASTTKTYRLSIYTYVAPPTSSTAVAFTLDQNSLASAVAVMTFTGVDQTTPYDANGTAQVTGPSNAPSVSVTTGVANAWIVGGTHMRGGDTDPFAAGTGVVEKYDLESGTDTTGDIGAAGGYREATSTGSYALAWTAAASDHGVIAAISLRPAETALNIAPEGLAVGVGIGTAVVGRGAVSVAPSGLAVSSAIGTATVGRGAVSIAPAGLAVAAAAGTAVVGRGVVAVSPAGMTVGVGIGTAAVGRGAVQIAPAGLAVAATIGAPALGHGLAVEGLVVAAAIGTAAVGRGAVGIAPEGMAVGAAFGTATVTVAGSSIAPPGLAVAVGIGTAVVGRGAVSIAPAGLVVAVSIGMPAVSADGSTILPSGLSVAIGIGMAVVGRGAVGIAPSGLAVAAAIGTAVIGRGAVVLLPAGTAVGVGIGAPAVVRGTVAIAPAGLAVGIVVGAATVSVVGEGHAILPAGLVVALAIGVLVVTRRPPADVPLYEVGEDVRVWGLPAEGRVMEVRM